MIEGQSLLSKIIDNNEPDVLDRYMLDRDDFATEGERQAYDFIKKYAAENGGAAPSYAVYVDACRDVEYIPEVSDSYEYLAGRIKEAAGKRRFAELYEKRMPELYRSKRLDDLISDLQKELDRIKMRSRVRISVGTDIARSSGKFLAEYEARKAGKSTRIWRSKFPSVNKALGGGYYSSNMYTFYARSGRGKSIITMEEAIEFAYQGATVLVWALEMGWFEWMARAFSSISARQGLIRATINGVDYDGGFENNLLQAGRLSEEYEAAFRTFVSTLNDDMPGQIILRSTNDEDFDRRDLRALESDIKATEADVVIVDPFYYLDYDTNTSKTAGGDAAATSKRLRIMTGRLNVVTIAVTQADEDAREKKDGVRSLNPPQRAEVKKTKQLLEDAAALIGIDTLAHEGRGIIEIGKGRNGGEDTQIELIYLPNYGIVRELPADEAEAARFISEF